MSLVVNYYGFNHEAVQKKFEGELKFINSIETYGYEPWAVYHNTKPNREKGHKDFFLLKTYVQTDGKKGLVISGISAEEFQKFRYVDAIRCDKCGDEVFSSFRHDYHSCKCGECFIDGGISYTKFGGPGKLFRADLYTGKEQVGTDILPIAPDTGKEPPGVLSGIFDSVVDTKADSFSAMGDFELDDTH